MCYLGSQMCAYLGVVTGLDELRLLDLLLADLLPDNLGHLKNSPHGPY